MSNKNTVIAIIYYCFLISRAVTLCSHQASIFDSGVALLLLLVGRHGAVFPVFPSKSVFDARNNTNKLFLDFF